MINILVMSADKEFLKVVRTALEGLPVKLVAECSRLKDAMETFRVDPAKMLILDMFLPDSSGLEAIKSLKRLDEAMVVLLLTRMRGRNLLDRAFRHGATDVLYYPVDSETIRHTVMHRLERLDDVGMVVFEKQPQSP